VRIYLEVGKTWTFAGAIDWPGWCRRGRGEEAAIEAFLAYEDRYRAVVPDAPAVGELEIVGRVVGDVTTDFGAPSQTGPWDDRPLDVSARAELAAVLAAGWTALDAAVALAPAELRKGPRGGGRDRDAVAAHVAEAERAYARKLGASVPPRTSDTHRRRAISEAVRSGVAPTGWPIRYGVRRLAWHVLDHVWEIEDRSS